MGKRILILGGYGNTGYKIAEYLLQKRKDVALIIAGRNLENAELAAERLRQITGGKRVNGAHVDAANAHSLEKAFRNIDMVVVASSTIQYTKNVVEEALKAEIDYLDTQVSSPVKMSVLRAFENEIETSGRIFITDGGFHPGLPAGVVRWIDKRIGPLEKANVYGALKLDWANIPLSKRTVDEFIEELRHFNTHVFKNGRWEKQGFSHPVKFDFGHPFFQQDCAPMMLEELKMLPEEIPTLKETGFYVTGFNKKFDYFLFPLIVLGMNIFPNRFRSVARRLFTYGMKSCQPPFGVKLVFDCKGEGGNMMLVLLHCDAYVLTATPIVACLLQYLDGLISRPGLHLQSWAVEPDRFMQDLDEMGVRLEAVNAMNKAI